MIADAAEALDAALAALRHHGLLLLSDPALPSVVGTITGGPLHGSWWSHPLGGLIYHVGSALEDHPDVLTTRLVAEKVTYVDRRLWPAVFAIGTARDAWQLARLSATASWLLAQTDAEGEVHTQHLSPPANLPRKRVADAARELERRVLVCSTEVHTPSGAHAKMLQTWPHWAASAHFSPPRMSITAAHRELQQAAARLVPASTVTVRLPWLAAISVNR